MTHICNIKLTIIGSDNDLSPEWRQAIIWTNAGILLIPTQETYFTEILSEIHTFSFKKRRLKMSSTKWRPFCLDFNVLIHQYATSSDAVCVWFAVLFFSHILWIVSKYHLHKWQIFMKGPLTHWGRGKMAAISQTTLSIAFSLMKMLQFRINFRWSLFLRVQWTIFQHWFR